MEGSPDVGAGFFRSTAANFSASACDMIAFYNYANNGPKANDGATIDWTMRALLAKERRSLRRYGWVQARTPMMGITQAFAGRVTTGTYWPGITTADMVQEAQAFCAAGAGAIAWYAWDDGSFGPLTLTPDSSAMIDAGSAAGCRPAAADGVRAGRRDRNVPGRIGSPQPGVGPPEDRYDCGDRPSVAARVTIEHTGSGGDIHARR